MFGHGQTTTWKMKTPHSVTCSAVQRTKQRHHSRRATCILIKLFQMSPIFSNTVKFSICYWEFEDVHWKSSLSQNNPGTFSLVLQVDKVRFVYTGNTLSGGHLSFSLVFHKSFMIFVDPPPKNGRNIGYILLFRVVSSSQQN